MLKTNSKILLNLIFTVSDSNHKEQILVVEYLKNLTKTNRFKLILKLLSKKEKQSNRNLLIILVVYEIFDMIKNISESELLPLKDCYIN